MQGGFMLTNAEKEAMVAALRPGQKPNELWITDVTEFHIPAGKVCLSPIVGCFCE